MKDKLARFCWCFLLYIQLKNNNDEGFAKERRDSSEAMYWSKSLKLIYNIRTKQNMFVHYKREIQHFCLHKQQHIKQKRTNMLF